MLLIDTPGRSRPVTYDPNQKLSLNPQGELDELKSTKMNCTEGLFAVHTHGTQMCLCFYCGRDARDLHGSVHKGIAVKWSSLSLRLFSLLMLFYDCEGFISGLVSQQSRESPHCDASSRQHQFISQQLPF